MHRARGEGTERAYQAAMHNNDVKPASGESGKAAAGETGKDVKDIKDVKKDVKHAVDQSADKLQELKTQGADKLEELKAQGAEKLEEIKTRAVEIKDEAIARGSDLIDRVAGPLSEQVAKEIQANPFKAVAIAFGLGYFGLFAGGVIGLGFLGLFGKRPA
jgi:ElaB/YqjD/DUF883 family membrane-anchored ribosome-binding protein